MLSYVVLLVLIVLSINVAVAVARQGAVMGEQGVSAAGILALRLSPLLYVVSLLIFTFEALPRASGVLLVLAIGLLVPGFVLGARVSSRLARVGQDVVERASRTASNVMWLAPASAAFIAGNLVVAFAVNSIGRFP